ncbi:MAG: hypothetical protein MZV65_23420 [Chromatiales bacterium]|nr:hypothetical protein [Chromatiales bacterium]
MVKAKEPPRRAHVEDPLTKDERAEIKRLIDEWVSTSNSVGMAAPAWRRLRPALQIRDG